MKKKNDRKKLIFAMLGIVVIIILSVVLFKVLRPKTHLVLQGECGVVMGTLMNKIETENNCRVQCLNECISRDMKISKSVFVSGGTTGCNSCDCYCV